MDIKRIEDAWRAQNGQLRLELLIRLSTRLLPQSVLVNIVVDNNWTDATILFRKFLNRGVAIKFQPNISSVASSSVAIFTEMRGTIAARDTLNEQAQSSTALAAASAAGSAGEAAYGNAIKAAALAAETISHSSAADTAANSAASVDDIFGNYIHVEPTKHP